MLPEGTVERCYFKSNDVTIKTNKLNNVRKRASIYLSILTLYFFNTFLLFSLLYFITTLLYHYLLIVTDVHRCALWRCFYVPLDAGWNHFPSGMYKALILSLILPNNIHGYPMHRTKLWSDNFNFHLKKEEQWWTAQVSSSTNNFIT